MKRKKQPEPLPATLKCPIGGEEWPATSFKSLVDIASEKFTYRGITFECPVHHFFTLSKAVRSGMFTRAQAKRLLEVAGKEREKYSNLPPDKVFPFLEKKLEESKKQAGW